MNKFLKALFCLPLAIILIYLLVVNVRLHFSTETQIIGRDTINYDLVKQLRSLKVQLHDGADKDMQHLYPEGFIFINAMYSLAWCNVIERVDHNSELFKEGFNEVDATYRRINSGLGRAPFDPILPIPYGAFYMGWSSYVLGKKLSLESVSARSKNEVKLYKYQCNIIASALKAHAYPASYKGHAWPADAVICVASLSMHDKLFTSQYNNTITNWVKHARANLDSVGLMPHSVYASSGRPREGSRGSSLSLMLIFLRQIDQEFATQQFARYEKHYVDSRLGLIGIREYRKGDYGFGDVDSGPVLLQMGASATIVGMGTNAVYRNRKVSSAIHNAVDAFGIPMTSNETRQYLFGTLPIADGFISWAQSLERPFAENESSFIAFHLYSLLAIAILLFLIWLMWKPGKKTLTIPW